MVCVCSCGVFGCAVPGCVVPGCVAPGCDVSGCGVFACVAPSCVAPSCIVPSCVAPGNDVPRVPQVMPSFQCMPFQYNNDKHHNDLAQATINQFNDAIQGIITGMRYNVVNFRSMDPSMAAVSTPFHTVAAAKDTIALITQTYVFTLHVWRACICMGGDETHDHMHVHTRISAARNALHVNKHAISD